MNTLEFISSIIKSIAWPSVILAIIIILRKPLKKLLNNINRITYSNVAIEFSKGLQAARQSLESVKTVFDLNVSGDKSFNKKENEIVEIANISPSASIAMSWSMVEDVINKQLPDVKEAPIADISILKVQGIISSDMEAVLIKLKKLKDCAVNGTVDGKLSYTQSIEYFEIAKTVQGIMGGDSGKEAKIHGN
ncbi:hypothetical protein CFK37_09970 [Virgibacillus phasianinus]|uniref:Uncharacterized protein n=1 Tax=Virgibacillus phasianinus TaxID=2017483 RepID=A0A220U3Z9_9BACI|nr:hypothetical protein [Virgibacillus phasianinus]ASK62453.1 hypothetical protein CFK37_09970 [Virgibacillus phasianinus]